MVELGDVFDQVLYWMDQVVVDQLQVEQGDGQVGVDQYQVVEQYGVLGFCVDGGGMEIIGLVQFVVQGLYLCGGGMVDVGYCLVVGDGVGVCFEELLFVLLVSCIELLVFFVQVFDMIF